MSLNVEQAVANGIRLLDEKEDGWREKIDLNTLRLEGIRDCILGQIYSSENTEIPFTYGLDKLGINNPCNYGFAKIEGITFSELNQEWRRQLVLEEVCV